MVIFHWKLFSAFFGTTEIYIFYRINFLYFLSSGFFFLFYERFEFTK